jgi:hypothetical protein
MLRVGASAWVTQASIEPLSLFFVAWRGASLLLTSARCKTCDAIIVFSLPKLPPLSLTSNVFSRSQPKAENKTLSTMHDALTIPLTSTPHRAHMSSLQKNMC